MGLYFERNSPILTHNEIVWQRSSATKMTEVLDFSLFLLEKQLCKKVILLSYAGALDAFRDSVSNSIISQHGRSSDITVVTVFDLLGISSSQSSVFSLLNNNDVAIVAWDPLLWHLPMSIKANGPSGTSYSAISPLEVILSFTRSKKYILNPSASMIKSPLIGRFHLVNGDPHVESKSSDYSLYIAQTEIQSCELKALTQIDDLPFISLGELGVYYKYVFNMSSQSVALSGMMVVVGPLLGNIDRVVVDSETQTILPTDSLFLGVAAKMTGFGVFWLSKLIVKYLIHKIAQNYLNTSYWGLITSIETQGYVDFQLSLRNQQAAVCALTTKRILDLWRNE